MLSNVMIGWLGIAVLLILLFVRIPIAYVLAIVGLGGYLLANGWGPALNALGLTFYSSVASYSFAVVPLFLIMGYFVYHSGVVTELFNVARKWIGHIPGGLAIATILGGAGFGAISGSGIASTATLARVTVPEMIRGGVQPKLAYGVVASAGPLAQMIPPSILMVMYGIIAEQPIGELLIGGILPGILTAVLYMVMVYIRVRLNPALAEPVSKVPLKERVSSLKNIWSFLLLAVIIIGGIYSGVFSPTEAGAVGAFAAFLLIVFTKRLNKHTLKDSILETVKTSSMVFLIVAASFLFGYFLSSTRLPVMISDSLVNLPVPPLVIMIGIIVMYLLLGMFIDMMAAMFITLPILLPAVEAMGFDLVWFGVVIVFLAEVALVTPPFGLSLFIIKGANPDANLNDIIKGTMPFILINLLVIALFIIFPQIITFLPSLMK